MGLYNSKIEIETIETTNLYNLQQNQWFYYTIIDTRDAIKFESSHIDLAELYVPSRLQTIEQHYNYIILYSDNSHLDAKLQLIYKEIYHKVPRTTKILSLIGGFEGFSSKYSFLCTNNSKFLGEGCLYPSEITNKLYLSNLGVATHYNVLSNLGITHIINCTVNEPFYFDFKSDFEVMKVIETLRVPITDTSEHNIKHYFQLTTDFIHNSLNINENNRILIHCKHGQSRSPTILAAYLIKYENYKVNEAITYMNSCRSKVGPNIGFIEQLNEWFNEINITKDNSKTLEN